MPQITAVSSAIAANLAVPSPSKTPSIDRCCRSEMSEQVSALGKVAQDAERMVRQDKRLTPSARAAGAGPVPSVDQCVQGLRDIW